MHSSAQQQVVGAQGHLAAATHGNTAHGGHGRYRQVFEVVEDAIDLGDAGLQLFGRPAEHLDEFGDVGAHDEDVLAACDHEAAQSGIGLYGVHAGRIS